MKAVTSDVYMHEMPGGQYTNLKIQANSLGLGGDWGKICKAYAAANKALGDIVKVGLRVYVCVCVCVCVREVAPNPPSLCLRLPCFQSSCVCVCVCM
jgi:hypothetical protein